VAKLPQLELPVVELPIMEPLEHTCTAEFCDLTFSSNIAHLKRISKATYVIDMCITCE
jgi:hypothetical protein